jgi:hypothetical protein
VVKVDTQPDEDLKGNAESNNIGQKHADNLVSKGQHDSIDDYDRASDGLDEREKEFGDESANSSSGSLDEASAEERRDAIANQEEAGDGGSFYNSASTAGKSTFAAKLLAGSKRFGPTGGLVGLLVGGFGFSSVILAPGSLLVAIEKAITNDSSDSTRTNIEFRRAYVSKLFTKNKSSTEPKIEDKLTEMSPDQKARWQEAGFDLNLDPEGHIDNMRFPDGTAVSDSQSFNTHAENTPSGREAIADVVDSRSAFFENSEFKDLLGEFNIQKSKRLSGSDAATEEERNKAVDDSFDSNIDTGEKAGEDSTAILKTLETETIGDDKGTKIQNRVDDIAGSGNIEKIGANLGKGALIATPISAACAVYNAAKMTNTIIKTKWIYDLVSFAYPFVRAAAQIEDQGTIEPEVVDQLANRLTWYDPNPSVTQAQASADPLNGPDTTGGGLVAGQPNPQYNKTAMDSQGLQMAFYGDFTGLSNFTKQYTSWGWEGAIDGAANTVLSTANSMLGKDNIVDTCTGANAVQTASLAGCVLGLQAAAFCLATTVIGTFAEHYLMPLLIAQLAKPALTFLSRVDLSSALEGEGAGDAIAAGIGLLLSGQSMGSGLMPAGGGNAAGLIKKFIADTNTDYYNNTVQLALDEAKKNPFDVTNQYSFMGQLASMINPYMSHDGTLFSKLANLTSVVSGSFASLPNTTASALFSEPSNMTLSNPLGTDATSNRIGKCQDPDMAVIGAACDWSGRIVGYTSDNVLSGLDNISNGGGGSSDILTNSINYLVQKKDIDPNTGGTTPNSDFGEYMTWCVSRTGAESKNQGFIPVGSSTAKMTDDDYDWTDGSKCMPQGNGSDNSQDNSPQAELDAFSTYYNWCYVQYATAERMTNCVDNTPETVSNVTPSTCGDGTTKSIYTCALQFDQYTYQMGAGHSNPNYGTTSWYQSFKANPPTDPNALKFDCSSLVMAAVVGAFGKDIPNQQASATFTSSPLWQKVSDASGKGGQQGDVMVWDGHVEIIQSDDGNGYATFGAHDDNPDPTTDIGAAHYGYLGQNQGDPFVGVYRYVGPGVGTKSV